MKNAHVPVGAKSHKKGHFSGQETVQSSGQKSVQSSGQEIVSLLRPLGRSLIATFRSQFNMYVGSNFDRPTDRSTSCGHPVTLAPKVLGPSWSRGEVCRNICFWTFQSERDRFSMVPAPEETTLPQNFTRKK